MSQRQLTLMAGIRLRSVLRSLERLLVLRPVIQTVGHMLVCPHLSPPPHPPPLLRALQDLLRPGTRRSGDIKIKQTGLTTHKVAKEIQKFNKVIEYLRLFPFLVDGSLK